VRRPAVPLLAALVVLGACSGGEKAAVTTAARTTTAPTTATSSSAPSTTARATTTTAATTTTTAIAPPTIAWKGCGENLECGTLAVPLDYDNPAKGTINLVVERRPARKQDQRIGSLLVDPGGPGSPGTELVEQASFYYSGLLRDRFDIVGWDPRGVGRSVPVDCTDDIDPVLVGFDPTPDSPAAVQKMALISAGFVAGCRARSGSILPYVSTETTARDMDRLREALGEPKISYFGYSYGSELGATWTTMFPDTVRAAVLDGALDANADWESKQAQQLAGLELGLSRAFDACAAEPSCPFNNGGDPMAAYEALAASLDAEPLVVDPERPPVNQALLSWAVSSSLRSSDLWDDLYRALADAQQGDGRALYRLYDEYVQRNRDGTFTNLFESYISIGCLDDNGPTDPAQFPAIDARLRAVAPHFFFGTAYNYACAMWPVRSASRLRLTGAGAGPIVVVGTTGDAITPLEGTRHLADDLDDGHLVTVEGDHHTGYGLNSCSTSAVDAYLVDLEVPVEGLVCA
jgi:pimeloyl-ACP methyl ester carboxylesterase